MKKTVDKYISALLAHQSPCCEVPGVEERCQQCPKYKIRINQIRRMMMNQNLSQCGTPDPSWDYVSIWEKIMSISNNLDELALFISQKERYEEKNNEVIISYLKTIKNQVDSTLMITVNENKLSA